jgi:Domain of unknown function (DUF6438)
MGELRLEGGVLISIASRAAAAIFLRANSTAAPQPASPPPAITSVSMHRSACLGTCTVEVLSTGEVRYEGEAHVNVKGHRTANISAQEFGFLTSSIERVGFFALQNRYRTPEDGCRNFEFDHPAVDITVTRGGQRKHVEYYYGCRGPAAIPRIIWLADTIDDVANSFQWVGDED